MTTQPFARSVPLFADHCQDIGPVRLFQNARYYPSLRPRIRQLAKGRTTFASRIDTFLNFREAASHFLLPVEQRLEWAFFTNGDDIEVQQLWAREQGFPSSASPAEILKAQIEAHRTEVFYNLDASGWDGDFIRGLPGCVKKTIAWHAAPLLKVDFAAYDLVVCNFPSILEAIKQRGSQTAYFFPGYDSELEPYAARLDRPIDVLFVGGYSRHHRKRAAILEAVAELAGEYKVVYHLDRSRLCRLAESPLGHVLPLAKHRRPSAIRRVASEPRFGRDYYELLSTAKIVLNGSIDMAGSDRGNMRCFEALGGGAMLLSDKGNYPDGMRDGHTMATYGSPDDAVGRVRAFLQAPEQRLALARAGHEMVSTRYSKEVQWKRFEALVAQI